MAVNSKMFHRTRSILFAPEPQVPNVQPSNKKSYLVFGDVHKIHQYLFNAKNDSYGESDYYFNEVLNLACALKKQPVDPELNELLSYLKLKPSEVQAGCPTLQDEVNIAGKAKPFNINFLHYKGKKRQPRFAIEFELSKGDLSEIFNSDLKAHVIKELLKNYVTGVNIDVLQNDQYHRLERMDQQPPVAKAPYRFK